MYTSESVLEIRAPVPILQCDKFVGICYPIEFSIQNYSSLNVSEGECFQSPKFYFGNNEEFEGRILLYPNGRCHKKCTTTSSDSASFCICLQYAKAVQWGDHNELCEHLKGTVKFSVKRESYNRENIEGNCITTPRDLNDKSIYLCGVCNCDHINLRAHPNLYKNGSLHMMCEISLPVQITLDGDVNALKSSNPRSKFIEDISSSLHNRELSDVTIVIGDKECKAHKVILAARSPVFARMFQTEMSENKRNVVEISDMDFDVLQSLLVYMYTDNVPSLEILGEALLSAAEKYQLDGLKEKCEVSLAEGLTGENAARIFLVADLHRANLLKDRAVEFIKRNRDAVGKTEGWKLAKELQPLVLAREFL